MLYRLSYASRPNQIIVAERTPNCKAHNTFFCYPSVSGTVFRDPGGVIEVVELVEILLSKHWGILLQLDVVLSQTSKNHV